MYIIKTKRSRPAFAVLFLLTLLVNNIATAQSKIAVNPLKKTSLARFQYDLNVYAAGGANQAIFFTVLNNNLYNKRMYSESTHASIGLNGYINIKSYLGTNISIGYMHERVAEDYGLFGGNGVYVNWLNTDINLSLLGFTAGICFDTYLGSRVTNKDYFSYEGINEHCFNNFAYGIYASYIASFTRLKLEFRVGNYMKPHLNADKLAYYNFLRTSVNTGFFDIKVYYRIYTSGNRIKSPQKLF